MCNLFSLTVGPDALARLFGAAVDRLGNLPPRPRVFPRETTPVLRVDGQGRRRFDLLSWGFLLTRQGKAPKPVTNARDDTLVSSGFWAPSVATRRCLVPLTAFSEPKGSRPAVWHWFGVADDAGDPRTVAFAGLWTRWTGRLKGAPHSIDTFAIVTTSPNAAVARIHPARMPVILHSQALQARWLDADRDQALSVIADPAMKEPVVEFAERAAPLDAERPDDDPPPKQHQLF